MSNNLIIYYIRHGEPNYELDCLTELGKKQAEALSNCLVKIGFDEIFVSPVGRAKETAEPTLQKLNIKPQILEFLSEGKAWHYYAKDFDGTRFYWPYHYPEFVKYANSKRIVSLGNDWYKDEKLLKYNFEEGVLYFKENVHKFMETQGYIWDEDNNAYKRVNPKNKRIALFAHEGNSRAFVSALQNVPYPYVALHTELGHTCIIKIVMKPVAGDTNYCIPVIYSSASYEHLYSEDVKMFYDDLL